MADSGCTTDYGRFDELAEEFAGRFRLGERPSIQEYVDRLPEMEAEIRNLFPALVEVEQVERAFEAPEPTLREQTSPDRLGDFRIVGEIGRGGMGIVYEAEQLSLGRTVALKVLPTTMKRDARSLERFRREARAAAQLHHTNIVPVFEVGEQGDSIFYAMQFIRGQGLNLVIDELKRLRDRSKAEAEAPPPPIPAEPPIELTDAYGTDRMAYSILTGRFTEDSPIDRNGATEASGLDPTNGPGDPVAGAARPVSTASSASWPGGASISMSESPGRKQPFFRSVAEIGRQVAGGLAYAHARGIVHRDIKPANLLLDAAGVAWIADFGLAKSGDDGLTESGDILGTLRFMAPERFRGQGDGRADIYALGATLYEMLTLRPAFDSPDRLRLIELVRNLDPPRPRSIDPAIPRDLETVVLKAMAKEPPARYLSASDMAEDLRRFLAGEAIRARRTSLPERLWRWCRRNPLAAGLAAAVAMMGVVVVAATTISAGREHAMRVEADNARQAAEKSLTDLREARSDEATFRRAIASQLDDMARDPANRDIQGVLDALYSQKGALERLNGRTLEAIETSLARRTINPAEPDRLYQVAMDLADCLPRPESPARPGNLDPAQADRAAALAIETLGQSVMFGLKTEEYNLAFMVGSNPHFRHLKGRPEFQALSRAISTPASSRVSGELVAFRGHADVVEAVVLSPDGARLLTVGGEGSARYWDATSGVEVLPPLALPIPARSAAISPDGKLAAIGGHDGIISFWNLVDGSRAGQLDAMSGGTVRRLAFTPDGKTMLSASHDGRLRGWDLGKRVERYSVAAHQGIIRALALGGDGRLVVTGGEDEMVRVWEASTGRPVLGPLAGHHGTVWASAIAPDGRTALTGGDDGCLIEWDLVEGRRLRTIWGQWATIRSIAISPDGRRALTGGPRNRLLSWNLAAGRVVHRFPGSFGGGMTCVAISPDGRRGYTGGTDRIARAWSLSEGAMIARDLAYVGRWPEAADAYRRAVLEAPNDRALQEEKSRLDWGLGRWADLIVDHEVHRRLYPGHTAGTLNSARVLLMAGDRAGYRRLVEPFREAFAGSSAAPPPWEVILATILTPDSGIEPADAVLAAEAETSRHPQVFGIQPVLGLALIRAGRFEEAVSVLLPVARDHSDWSCVATTWPMLAMAYHGLADGVEARKWLEKVREIRAQKTPRFGPSPIDWAGPWPYVWDWIDFELLAREAETTIGAPVALDR